MFWATKCWYVQLIIISILISKCSCYLRARLSTKLHKDLLVSFKNYILWCTVNIFIWSLLAVAIWLSVAVFMTKFYLIILLSDPQIVGFDQEVGSCGNCLGNSHSSILGEEEDLVIFCHCTFRILAMLFCLLIRHSRLPVQNSWETRVFVYVSTSWKL